MTVLPAASTLHLLTPVSSQAPQSLLAEGTARPGDQIADLRRFPAAVFEVADPQTIMDITASLNTGNDSWAAARDWLVRFTLKTGLHDLLTVHGYSFWWSLNSLRFSPTMGDLGNSFVWVDVLAAIFHQRQPGAVIVYGNHRPIVDLAGQIFAGLSLETIAGTTPQASAQPRPSRRPGLVAMRVLVGIVYLIYGWLRRADIYCFSDTNLLRTRMTGETRRLTDIYLDDTAQALRKRGWRVGFVEKYGWNATWRGLFARGPFFPSDVIDLLSQPLLHKWSPYRPVVSRWHKRWDSLRPALQPHLGYRGYDIGPLLMPLIAHEFTRRAPQIEIMADLWRRILRLWRPRLLLVNNYYRPSAVAPIVTARALNIPTAELQHGVIGKNHTAYLVPRELLAQSKPPLCDSIIVWGKHVSELLVEAGVYQLEQIAVCGSPRVDLLLGQMPAREVTLARLGISRDAQVILYTSNMVAGGLMPSILDSISQVPDTEHVHWIVKLHPREKTRRAWEAAVHARNLSNVTVLEGEFDLYALLTACTAHVSFASTTLIESAMLGKLNLGLKITQVQDPIGFMEAKAAIPVAPERLGETALAILNDSVRLSAALAEQRAFAEDWCWHDGQALQRVVSHLEKTMEQAGDPGWGDHDEI